MTHIIALGGGGFSVEPDYPYLDQYILNLTAKQQPKVCFLGQASGESDIYQLRFYSAFTKLGTKPSHLSLFRPVDKNWRDHLLSQDIIYVGGGNTRSMLALWRDWGIDQALYEAWQNGVILAGVSAGAICWFEQCVTDSTYPLGLIKGLGFLRGSACPHYRSEPDHRPAYKRMVEDGVAKNGIALDDFAAAHYIDGELEYIVTARQNAAAFRLLRTTDEVIEELLPTDYLGS